MSDNKDTSLIKMDCQNKAVIYNLLFGKAHDALKHAKEIALLYLGSPYYAMRVLEEYNNIKKVNIFTTAKLKFIWEPFEKDRRFKIWYVKDTKDTFKECDMKFDCIIMNPPYDRNLHLKVLTEAIKHLKDDNSKVVNLSPVRWLQDPLAKFKEKNDYHRFEDKISKHCTNIETIKTEDARKLFGAELLQPLGIYCCNKSNNNNIYKTAYKVPEFIDRVYKKILKYNVFNTLICKKYTDDLQHFVLINIMAPPMKYGKPMFDAVKTWCGYFCNGKNTNGLTYRQAKEKNTRATRGNIDQDNAVVFKTANEAKNCYNAMQTKFVQFFVMTSVVDVNVHQNVIPWMSDYTKPWTDERFYKFFNITPDEQKIIEDTMAKYK